MPNHVTNLLCAPAEVISALMGDDGVDFNRIIRQPELIAKHDSVPSHVKCIAEVALGIINFNPSAGFDMASVTARLHASNAARQIQNGPHAKDLSDADFGVLVDFMRSYRQCGYTDWYDWNCGCWGTKWNGYRTKRPSLSSVEFQTAWSAPHPVIETLASNFPLAEVRHSWADEDTGHNCGSRVYRGTLVSEVLPESGSKEAYELAFSLDPELKREYSFDAISGNYKYREDGCEAESLATTAT